MIRVDPGSLMNQISRFAIALGAVLLAGAPIYGQGLTGSITGTVVDQTGSAIAGAEVTLTSTTTNLTRQTTTDSSGDFVFTQVLPSNFRLSIAAKGFRKYEQTDIILTATERMVLRRISMEIGELTQTVEVSAETARLQTQSAERSGLISLEQTKNVPLKGRDYLGLVKLLPGVIDTANRNAPGWNNLGGITINGNRAGTINLTLDGISSLDTGSMGGPYLAPSVDAVAEGAADELPGRVRTVLGRHDQHGDQERDEGVSWRRLLLRAQRGAERERVFQ
jgi:hypothetical protein